MITQNVTVACNCIIVVAIMFFKNFVQVTWDGLFFYYVQGGMIILNIVSNLASMTTKISIERDWVIVVAQHVYVPKKSKKSKSDDQVEQTEKQKLQRNLTDINSNVRRINLGSVRFGAFVRRWHHDVCQDLRAIQRRHHERPLLLHLEHCLALLRVLALDQRLQLSASAQKVREREQGEENVGEVQLLQQSLQRLVRPTSSQGIASVAKSGRSPILHSSPS